MSAAAPWTSAVTLPPQEKQMLLRSSCAREALDLACSKTLLMHKAILGSGKRPVGRWSDPKRGMPGTYVAWQANLQYS